MAMDSDTSTARGLLMLSLRPILTTTDTDLVTPAPWIRRTPRILWPWTRIRLRQEVC